MGWDGKSVEGWPLNIIYDVIIFMTGSTLSPVWLHHHNHMLLSSALPSDHALAVSAGRGFYALRP